LGATALGLLGVQHQTARGWEPQPEWLSGLLRVGEVVVDGHSDVRRRAVIITPHPSPVVALLSAHLALRRFQASRLPDRWWDHEPTPKAAVRLRSGVAELLLFRQAERRPGGDVTLRFGTSRGTRLMVSEEKAIDLVPIPYEVLPDPSKAKMLDLRKRVFDGVHDFLGMASIPYALGTDTSVTVVGRKDETRHQLEQNSVRDSRGGVARLAALARVKEFAHANSYRSRWLSPEGAASGEADEGSLLILNGGAAVGAAVHDLEDHAWIAVLDRSSPSLTEAVHQVEQYYYSVETDRIELPSDIALPRGHEILLFEEPA
jgi:hypothetical protein